MNQNEPLQLEFNEKGEEAHVQSKQKVQWAIIIGAFFINFICELYNFSIFIEILY